MGELLGRQGDRGTGEGDRVTGGWDTWGTGGEDRCENRGGMGKIDEGIGEGDSSALSKNSLKMVCWIVSPMRHASLCHMTSVETGGRFR